MITSDDARLGYVTTDFRVGGQDTHHEAPEGESPFLVTTRYEEIVPDRRIISVETVTRDGTMFSVSLITVDIDAAGTGAGRADPPIGHRPDRHPLRDGLGRRRRGMVGRRPRPAALDIGSDRDHLTPPGTRPTVTGQHRRLTGRPTPDTMPPNQGGASCLPSPRVRGGRSAACYTSGPFITGIS